MKTKRLVLMCTLATVFLLASCAKKKKGDISQYTGEKPKQTIKYDYAKKLEKEYVRTRANPLDSLLNKRGVIKGKDVRDIWFDLETMKKYIAYVEAESKKKGYKKLGLRVYYGAYPGNNQYPDPSYATVFFMPTHNTKGAKMNFVYQDPNENSIDIEGLNYGSGGHPPTGL